MKNRIPPNSINDPKSTVKLEAKIETAKVSTKSASILPRHEQYVWLNYGILLECTSEYYRTKGRGALIIEDEGPSFSRSFYLSDDAMPDSFDGWDGSEECEAVLSYDPLYEFVIMFIDVKSNPAKHYCYHITFSEMAKITF